MAEFRRLIGVALALWALGASVALAADAPRRVALVIGNSQYQSVEHLPNTANDAKLIAATLQKLGFVLVGGKAQTDLDLAAMKKAVLAFSSQLANSDVAVFYYAGHGLQMAGSNYLVPIDANPTKAADADFQLLDASAVLRQMEASGVKLKLMILDACRNNPFGGRGLRDVGGGLAQMQAPRGTVISYATQPGAVASDGPAGGNGPYAVALAQSLVVPGVDVFNMLNRVALEVANGTADAQQPWFSTSPLDGEFYFAGTAPVTPSVVQPPSAPVPTSSVDADALFWQSVVNTTNPANFQGYLDHFPKGTYATLAQERLAALTAPKTPAPGLPSPAGRPPALPAIEIVQPNSALPRSLAQFSGIWLGKWDGTFYTAIAVKNIQSNGTADGIAEIEYRWVERVGEPYSLSPVRLARIENGTLSFSGVKLTIDPNKPNEAVGELVGRNNVGPIDRLSNFIKEPPKTPASSLSPPAGQPAVQPAYSNQEPPNGGLAFGQRIYVDDGTCPSGQIKQLIGGDNYRHIPRQSSCVAR